jgi:hypothetical protein
MSLQNKRVRFAELTECIIIPHRKEYNVLQHHLLWWSNEDNKRALDEFQHEVKAFAKTQHISLRDAKHILYGGCMLPG